MAEAFWFNRMVEYWSLPLHLDLPALVRRARLQLVQAGTFGPMFYGLADDPSVPRQWVGMPLVGIEPNLELAQRTIAGVQAAGARFVGQFSMSWHYGDHERGKGLFGAWERLWTAPLLGAPPCAAAADAMERLPDGSLRCWPIEGRPYRTYSGCFCNPLWLAVLKAMVTRAIALGVDGLMAHHNFSSFCGCQHCRAYLRARLEARFDAGEREALFGDGWERGDDLRSPVAGAPAALAAQLRLELERSAHRRRKEMLDEVLLGHGRSLKPDLLVAQWYHKYDFGPHDERSLLPASEWARGESYIWYSQGAHKGESQLAHGYLADMGLPARFMYAAGGGRPFIANKYDHRRLRLSIAEAAANGAAALAFHVPGGVEAGDELARDEYCAALVRYHGFVAAHAALYHPARPWADVALVYPRRDELHGETGCLEALHRAGRVLEDRHVPFAIVLDEQLIEQGAAFATLIVPRPQRLTATERSWLHDHAARGGLVVMLESAGEQEQDAGGRAAGSPEAAAARAGTGLRYLAVHPWAGQTAEVRPGVRVPVWPAPEADEFGRALLEVLAAGGVPRLVTDAPWYVRVRAWCLEAGGLALHWVNYRQVESAATETPWPVGPIAVDCAVPPGQRIVRLDWHRPEAESAALPFVHAGGRLRFAVPEVVVYGIVVVQFDWRA